MAWISPDELAQYRKALESGGQPSGQSLTPLPRSRESETETASQHAGLEKERATPAIPMVPPTVNPALDDKIAASPTAAPIKNVLMEAMLRALPPGLQEKVRAHAHREALAKQHPQPPGGPTYVTTSPNPALVARGDPVLDSAADAPVIIEGECRHE